MSHRFDPTILREYDIRGIVGETLSNDDAHAIGRAYAIMLGEAGGQRVAVGLAVGHLALLGGRLDQEAELLLGEAAVDVLLGVALDNDGRGAVALAQAGNPLDRNRFSKPAGAALEFLE